ncbi:MAG TPA: hypothetical protein VE685_27585 [Thermoanaerobaculia bacterium]|nr:hypothetical protein [Thermoanaerobaculia bacterium]
MRIAPRATYRQPRVETLGDREALTSPQQFPFSGLGCYLATQN